MSVSRHVHDLDALLRSMGATLGNYHRLRFEWSLQITEGRISDRDRFTCWVSAGDAQLGAFDAVALQLEVLGAPVEILEAQGRLAPHSVKQGISVSRSDERLESKLYLHHYEPETLTDRYEAYRWSEDDRVETASYEFHFLPETPAGETPLSLVDPVFVPVLGDLLGIERLQQLSGFWLRRRGGRIDQVDLIFPWQPPLAELGTQLSSLAALLGAPDKWIDTYRKYPLRHLAFASAPGDGPRFSVYFSGRAGGVWPDSVGALQRIVRLQGTAEHAMMERIFFRSLPPATTDPNRRLDDFYSTERVDAWRQVLGPEMHYHAGIFERPLPGAAPDDALAAAAQRRAVEELYPFLPAGGCVYDVGCGWGGAMRMLVRQLRCRTLGITISRTQFRHCSSRGLQVRYGDAETTLPPGNFDCMLLLESLSHIRNKIRLLRVLRVFGKRLVMRVNCQDAAPNSVNFGGTMHMIRSVELHAMIEEAGWRIVHWRDRRPEALPSVYAWQRKLKAVPVTNDYHLETLRAYCRRVLRFPEKWAACNPLIEVVAE